MRFTEARDPKRGLLDLLVYYEIPQGQRDEVKLVQKSENDSTLSTNAKCFQELIGKIILGLILFNKHH